ncbi:hypothetical protein GCK72_007923 [Caenorhabditis remanei]|uniref:Uncharacterized protein n=1 Tax=Caenorhabditis remanei TaxID=31234 RepID=A0A6A5HNN9_CAERE|nr:hypothetical protein GCK72_007923 [Caenorhabditis remanei]KAF1767963.1 hypothetical protein GCK72_007923 [Caenorhabditis remanei]
MQARSTDELIFMNKYSKPLKKALTSGPCGPCSPTGPGRPASPSGPCGPSELPPSNPASPRGPGAPRTPLCPAGPAAIPCGPGGPGGQIIHGSLTIALSKSDPSFPSVPSFPRTPSCPALPSSPGAPGGPAGPCWHEQQLQQSKAVLPYHLSYRTPTNLTKIGLNNQMALESGDVRVQHREYHDRRDDSHRRDNDGKEGHTTELLVLRCLHHLVVLAG